MSAAEARFREAASFFAIFAQSPWKACHVRTGEMEIFVARDRALSNPMMGDAPAAAAQPTSALRAPHLGTLVALSDVGTVVAPGQIYGRFELLGETIELAAEQGGVVADHLLPIGALAEFDQPLVSLRGA
jgi:biotin carboxyl carrier protein